MHTHRFIARVTTLLPALLLVMGCSVGSTDSPTDPSTDPTMPATGSGGPSGAGTPSSSSGGPAAGSSGAPGGTPSTVGGTVPEPPDFKGSNIVWCPPINNGTAAVFVNGIPRLFDVQLPANTSKMALLFEWHGWNQLPGDFKNQIVYDVPAGQWRAFDPNAFPMPLMIVTPWSTKLIPPFGLDWDIVDGSVDFPFFEAMMQCVEQQYSIEKTRVYSFGFSAGSVFTNLLSAKYPNVFAAIISESGVWFGDPPEQKTVTVPIMPWKWPALNPADGGAVLLTHGGPNDQVRPIVNLEQANIEAIPFLHANGRTVTECVHDFGHTLAPDLTQGMIYQYMWEHQLGGPPGSGLTAGFPTPAKPVGSTTCTFHPK